MSTGTRWERAGARDPARGVSRSGPRAGTGVVAAATAAIVLAEIASAAGQVAAAGVVDALLIPLLLGAYAGRSGVWYRELLLALALVAMVRVLSIVAAVPFLPAVTWYVTVGGSLLLAELLAMRVIDQPFQRLDLVIRRPSFDLAVAALGIPAGLIGYVLLRPAPLMGDVGPLVSVVGMVILVVFAAFPEELLFRGFLQRAAIDAFELTRFGVAYAAILSAVMYLGSGSLPYTVAIGAYGLVLGAVVARGGSIWGATASHGLALIGMAFIWPVVL